MSLGTIVYGNLEEMHTGIAALVREGVTFEADASTLTVTLTGGY
jgi:hypothetical protein